MTDICKSTLVHLLKHILQDATFHLGFDPAAVFDSFSHSVFT